MGEALQWLILMALVGLQSYPYVREAIDRWGPTAPPGVPVEERIPDRPHKTRRGRRPR